MKKKIFVYNRETLGFEKPKKKVYVGIAVSIGALFMLGWYTGTNKYIINKITHTTEVTDTMLVHGEKFSEEALIRLLKDTHIKYPHIVLAQAKLESGEFKSKMFRENWNLFGMKLARQRITTALGEQNGHAYYRDWIDGVHDYGMYQSAMMCNVSNEVEYFAKLDERYAEDTIYVNKLKHIIEVQNLKAIFQD
jgi:uncharacterized FlgJ-related protein